MIRAGELNRLVVIQESTVTKDTSGAPQTTWSEFAQVWGGRVLASGREFWQARQVTADATAVWKIRYLAGVVPAMRLLDGSTVYDIQAVLPDPRDSEMLLTCRQVI